MKNAILFVFILQLAALTITGTMLFVQNRYTDLLYRGNSIIHVAVSTDEEYDVFLSWIRERDISVVRMSMGSNDNVRVLGLSDLAYNNMISLLEGRLPEFGEFISDVDTGDYNQSGIMQPLLPNYSFKIYGLHKPERLHFYVHYTINITNEKDLNNVINALAPKGISIQLIDTWIDNPFTVLFSVHSITQVMLLLIFIFSSFMVMFVSLNQYVIFQLKSINVLLSLGYSWLRALFTVALRLASGKNWLVAMGLLCIALGVFLLLSDAYRPFYAPIIAVFFISVVFLTVMYFFVLSCAMLPYLYTKRYSLTTSLKGMKPHIIVQIMNCLVKFTHVLLFVVTVAFLVDSFRHYITTRVNMQSWITTENIYHVQVHDIGQFHDLAIEVEFYKTTTLLIQYLFMNKNGFFMDADNIRAMEFFGEEYTLTGLVTNYAPTHITVSPNFFSFNPIITSTGVPIYQQLIFSDNVLNLLVPEALSPIYGYIYDSFLDYFYFNRFRVPELYRDIPGETWDPSVIKPLTVNIISVENGQYYFTFSPDIRQGTGNRILDPVVVVYTGNFHPSYSYSMVTRVLFFEYDDNLNITPSDYLSQVIGADGVVYATSVWASIVDRLSQLQRNYYFTLFLSLFILMGYLVTSFSLFTNYFACNRYSIVIKATWGYSVFRRYINSIVMLFLPTLTAVFVFIIVKILPLPVLLPTFSMQGVYMVGVFLIVIDTLYFISLEKILLKKSINNILKGDAS